jgi:hypothetical protein
MPLEQNNKLYLAREWFKEKKRRNEAENAILADVIATIDAVDAGQDDAAIPMPKADKLQAVYDTCEKERANIKTWAQAMMAAAQNR